MSVENDIHFRKSNPLIQALGSPSPLAYKIMISALVHAEQADPRKLNPILSKEDWARIKQTANADYTQGLVAIFPQNEIRQIAKKSNSGSYYESLNKLLNTNPATKMDGFKSLQNQWNVIFSNKGFHEHVSLITACAYDEKTRMVFVKFSNEKKIQELLYDLKGNYTVLSYHKMMQFKTQYAPRMYEIIKSRIDFEDAKTEEIKSHYEFVYNIAHLKYMIGVLNPLYSSATESMLQVVNPDYDAISELIQGEGMPKWYDFKRNCLEKCKKEINEITEFNFDYEEGQPKGRGGKVINVVLKIDRKPDVVDAQKKFISEDEMLELIDEVRDFLPVKLSSANIKVLLKHADYDLDKIKNAINVLDSCDDSVENVMGFLVKAIKRGWKPKLKRQTVNSFNNFEQNTYDFQKLEEELLDN